MTVVQKEAVRAKLKHLNAVGEESASHRESKHDVMERVHALMLPGPRGHGNERSTRISSLP